MPTLGEITKRFNEGQAKVLMKEFQDAQVMMNVLERNAAAGRERILSGEGPGFGVIVTPSVGQEMTDLVTVPDSPSAEPTSNKDKQLQYWRGQHEVAQRRIAVLEAERSQVPIMESVVGLKAANAHLMRQLAAQALAHAEGMEAMRGAQVDPDWEPDHAIISRLRENERQCMARVADLEMELNLWRAACVTPETDPQDASQLQAHLIWWPKRLPVPAFNADGTDIVWPAKFARNDYGLVEKITKLEDALKISETRAYIAEGRVAELEMRVTPTTKPTDAQQTASDMASPAPPELRPDGTRKPVAREWVAPKSASDRRRIGG